MAEQADITLQITQEDLNDTLRENPALMMQLRIHALTRTCQEQADRIMSLELEVETLNKKRGKNHANGSS